MRKVKIIGAGSIGNHLAQAARRMGWSVDVVDTDSKALQRMKEDIYPKRYGAWDDSIGLYESGKEPKGGYDVIFIGTPPDSHLPVAIKILKEEEPPKILQIEKPVCGPLLENVNEFIEELNRHPKTNCVVGYDHVLGENTRKVEEYITSGELGRVLTIDAETRSEWSGILRAHPWLSGPQETYLGHWARGGGASGEHSHALNLWQHFAHCAGAGKVQEVSAFYKFKNEGNARYDELCLLTLTTDNGITGRVVQDVVTRPKRKIASIQFERGRVEWYCDVTKTLDRVLVLTDKEEKLIDIPKTRPDEFWQEMKHINDILEGKIKYEDSPVRIERGLDTMIVLNVAYRSFKNKKVECPVYPYEF